MWEAIKNALIGVKDATGIEIPGLPVDLGSIGESAATAVQGVSESASGIIDGAAPAIDAVGGSVGDLTATAATAVESATQGLPDAAGGLVGGAPEK